MVTYGKILTFILTDPSTFGSSFTHSLSSYNWGRIYSGNNLSSGTGLSFVPCVLPAEVSFSSLIIINEYKWDEDDNQHFESICEDFQRIIWNCSYDLYRLVSSSQSLFKLRGYSWEVLWVMLESSASLYVGQHSLQVGGFGGPEKNEMIVK